MHNLHFLSKTVDMCHICPILAVAYRDVAENRVDKIHLI